MNLIFRPARPEDADASAPLIRESGPAFCDYCFEHPSRGTTVDFFRFCFRQGGGELGYDAHLAGEVDGELVAIGTGFSGADASRFTWVGLRQVFAFYGPAASPGVLRRVLQAERIVQPPKGDEFAIAHVTVSAPWRGKGIGRQLMDRLLDLGRDRGCTVAVLDVSELNTRAKALYEQLGFAVTHARPSTLENRFARVPTHFRMERNL